MNPITVHVIFGNPDSGVWDDIHEFDVAPTTPENLTNFLNVESYKAAVDRSWETVQLPSNEVIDIMVLYNEDDHYVTLNVRQGKEALVQVLGQGMPSVVFRTISGETINIQIGPRDYSH